MVLFALGTEACIHLGCIVTRDPSSHWHNEADTDSDLCWVDTAYLDQTVLYASCPTADLLNIRPSQWSGLFDWRAVEHALDATIQDSVLWCRLHSTVDKLSSVIWHIASWPWFFAPYKYTYLLTYLSRASTMASNGAKPHPWHQGILSITAWNSTGCRKAWAIGTTLLNTLIIILQLYNSTAQQ